MVETKHKVKFSILFIIAQYWTNLINDCTLDKQSQVGIVQDISSGINYKYESIFSLSQVHPITPALAPSVVATVKPV